MNQDVMFTKLSLAFFIDEEKGEGIGEAIGSLVGNVSVRSVNKGGTIDTGDGRGRCSGNVMRPVEKQEQTDLHTEGVVGGEGGREGKGKEYWLSLFEREIEMDTGTAKGRGGEGCEAGQGIGRRKMLPWGVSL